VSLDAGTGLATVRGLRAPFATRTIDPLELLKLAISNELDRGEDDSVEERRVRHAVDPSYRSNLLPGVVCGLSAGKCIAATTDASGALVLSALDCPNADEAAVESARSGWQGSADGKEQPMTGRKCIVCRTRSSTLAYHPCGHLCLCRDCAPKWQETSSRCPVCNGTGEPLTIYFSFGR
jgi:hypothetical protein